MSGLLLAGSRPVPLQLAPGPSKDGSLVLGPSSGRTGAGTPASGKDPPSCWPMTCCELICAAPANCLLEGPWGKAISALIQRPPTSRPFQNFARLVGRQSRRRIEIHGGNSHRLRIERED